MSLDKLPIVVVIPTKNEEANIETTVKSVLDDFEAVVVVDSASTDRTVEIASGLGAEVASYVWDGRYPKKKQWCLDRIRTDIRWVLFLDGDEVPGPGLVDELRSVFSRPVDVAAFDIPLSYYFAGRPLRHGYTVVKRSLLDRERSSYPTVDDLDAPGMGEQEGHYQPLAAPVGALSARIEHRDLDPVRSWFQRHNRYSDWEAWLALHPDVEAQVRALKSRQGQLFAMVPFKPALFFLYAYVYRRGFLDGRSGLDYALALSFYRWQIALKVREARNGGS
jgi:glycosyltransferase involved in cell wall biosynthesis